MFHKNARAARCFFIFFLAGILPTSGFLPLSSAAEVSPVAGKGISKKSFKGFEITLAMLEARKQIETMQMRIGLPSEPPGKPEISKENAKSGFTFVSAVIGVQPKSAVPGTPDSFSILDELGSSELVDSKGNKYRSDSSSASGSKGKGATINISYGEIPENIEIVKLRIGKVEFAIPRWKPKGRLGDLPPGAK